MPSPSSAPRTSCSARSTVKAARQGIYRISTMLLSAQAYQRIDRELAKFPADQRKSAIMAALAIAQEEKGWVSTEIVADVAAYIGVPAIAVQEIGRAHV